MFFMLLKQASDEFLTGYFSTHERRKKTKDAYRSDLAQFLKFAGQDIGIQSLDSALIEQWAAHLQQKDYSPTSIRRKIVVLKVFCSYWVRKGVLNESPFWRVKLSLGRIEQLPRTLTGNEVRLLFAHARQHYSTMKAKQNGIGIISSQFHQASSQAYRETRNLALVDLLFATGIRVGELSALNLQDFLIDDAIFKIQGKGGRDRLAFIVDERIIKFQRKHLEIRRRIKTENSALFLNASGGRLSTQGIANVISQLCQDAKIERHITPHMLRHTVATLLLRNGVDIRVVQEFLGHASIATTQRYTHITKEHLIGELRKNHPCFELRGEI
jgi:integrase/recombinase XerD